jgi:autophagy-related protein 33
MEASYEVLGDVHSEGTGSASGEDVEEEQLNGEEVHGEVEAFLKTTIVQTAISSVAFLMAVIGIWGDGVAPVYGETVVYM